jgi:sugar lactone lactonase YvrE
MSNTTIGFSGKIKAESQLVSGSLLAGNTNFQVDDSGNLICPIITTSSLTVNGALQANGITDQAPTTTITTLTLTGSTPTITSTTSTIDINKLYNTLTCRPGSFCPYGYSQIDCPEGYYCPGGSLYPILCPSGASCPVGSIYPFPHDPIYSTSSTVSVTTNGTPYNIIVSNDSNIFYITDPTNNVIMKGIYDNSVSKPIFTQLQTSEPLNQPSGITMDIGGNIYVSDTGNHVIRKIDPTGTITTFAGTGIQGYNGDGEKLSVQLNSPTCITVDMIGNVYFSDAGNDMIRKIDLSGYITTLAGHVYDAGIETPLTRGYSGDGGPATQALLNSPNGLVLVYGSNISSNTGSCPNIPITEIQGIYFSDKGNNVIRCITYKNDDPSGYGMITTVAGTGQSGYSGDGGSSLSALLNTPKGLAFGSDGSLYVSDYGNNCVRKITSSGIITTIAGGKSTIPNYIGIATFAKFTNPNGLYITSSNELYVVTKDGYSFINQIIG